MKRSDFLKIFGLTAISGAVIEAKAEKIYPKNTIGHIVQTRLNKKNQKLFSRWKKYFDTPIDGEKYCSFSTGYILTTMLNLMDRSFIDWYYGELTSEERLGIDINKPD